MSSGDLAQRAVDLAGLAFGGDLSLAFVGGSRASGVSTGASDIDVFVVIEASDRRNEGLFAEGLRELHLASGLHFDHYGEIFSRASLDNLLDFAERLTLQSPALRQSPCYRGNCIASIFRKAQVVLRFLQGPKIHTRGSAGLLQQLEARSREYFTKWDVAIPPSAATALLPPGTEQHRLATIWQGGPAHPYPIDTPIGIGLERWFGDNLPVRLARLDAADHWEGTDPVGMNCPLIQRDSLIHAAQCLAVEDATTTSKIRT